MSTVTNDSDVDRIRSGLFYIFFRSGLSFFYFKRELGSQWGLGGVVNGALKYLFFKKH